MSKEALARLVAVSPVVAELEGALTARGLTLADPAVLRDLIECFVGRQTA
jgi:hypothetical protein